MIRCGKQDRERKAGAEGQHRRGRVALARCLRIALAMAGATLLAVTRVHAQRADAQWRGRSATLENRVTWSITRTAAASQWKLGLSARRRIADGGWDWMAVDVARPIASVPGLRRVAIRGAARYEPKRHGLRLIGGLERSVKLGNGLALTGGCYVHVAGSPGTRPGIVATGVRMGASARTPLGGTLTAVVGYGERPGGIRLDLTLRSAF